MRAWVGANEAYSALVRRGEFFAPAGYILINAKSIRILYILYAINRAVQGRSEFKKVLYLPRLSVLLSIET